MKSENMTDNEETSTWNTEMLEASTTPTSLEGPSFFLEHGG